MKPTLGFIGQGWIGKNYADHYEERGFSVIRYSLEKEHIGNKDKIKECDIVFIAVPTPTTPKGFDDSRVREAVGLVGREKIAVIKSTIPPGTTRSISEEYPGVCILHVPEFLREAFARYDVDNPERLIIGIPEETGEYQKKSEEVINLGPRANYTKIVRAEEAEFIKYAHNTIGYTTVVFANLLYDLALAHGVEWSGIKEAILNNPWYSSKYLDPVHKGGRGAGGDCFIKDFATFRMRYEEKFPEDAEGIALLRAFEAKNNRLLRETQKDLDLLRGVYGE
jgi:UDPglucose 6-dehydrogenase